MMILPHSGGDIGAQMTYLHCAQDRTGDIIIISQENSKMRLTNVQRAMIMSMGLSPNNMNNNMQRAVLMSLGVNVLTEEYAKLKRPTYSKSNINKWREQAIQSALRRATRNSPLKRKRENNNRNNPRNRRVNETNNNYRSYLVKWLTNRNKYFNATNRNIEELLRYIRSGKYVVRRRLN